MADRRPHRATSSMSALEAVPLLLWVSGGFSALMMLPALHAAGYDDYETARAFFYSGIMGIFISTLCAMAVRNRASKSTARGQLLSLIAVYSVLPLLLALPFHEALGTTRFLNAWLEMVSAITTTGLPLFEPDRLNDSLHLWRALVAWFGGLITLVAAVLVLAPLSLGGFELTEQARQGPGAAHGQSRFHHDTSRAHLWHVLSHILPIYVGLTLVCMMLLMSSGERQLVAACHAMAIIATSGITPLNGLEAGQAGRIGELIMIVFLLFATTRLIFARDRSAVRQVKIQHDPELQIALVAALAVMVLLVLSHALSVLEGGHQARARELLAALWGALFTAISFLTTTGFTSADWNTSQSWADLQTSSLLLIALAIMGGGVATTAGGIKLLRVYALYQHGLSEMHRLAHPSSVPRPLRNAPKVRREGVYLAWLFFMLFVLTIATIMLVLSALGTPFEDSILLSVATLTTTGPLVNSQPELNILTDLDENAKAVLITAMVVGRMEALALLALLNPALWRR